MFVTDADEFRRALSGLPALMAPAVTARAAFLVTPGADGLADESRADNRYMNTGEGFDAVRARAQHGALMQALRSDRPTFCFPGSPDTPDDMFPNNVFATTPGRLIVGRMHHPVRRAEADREDIRGFFTGLLGHEVIDLSRRHGLTAELTGSLVIDHARGIGYCGLSERCDLDGARAMHEAFGLRLTFAFPLAAGEYHTNVVLSVLAGRAAVIAADGFADPAVARAIAEAFDGRALSLAPAQKAAFAANVITLSPERVWMSGRAARSLSEGQHERLREWGFRVGRVELDEIEKAGGSLRCCVAEIF